MKMKTGKRLASFFLSACIALSVLFGAVVFASADTIPTSESVSELNAVYTYVENEDGTGTIAIDAKAQNIEAEEYVMFNVYQNVNDIADPTNERQNAPVTSKGFYAADVLNGEALAKELPLTPLKLNGKCVLGVQVTNRGENNDWVYTYITTALKLNPNGGTLTGEGELQVKLGFSILDELGTEERVSRDYYKFVGWSETEDGEVIGNDFLMSQYGDELFAIWEQLKTTVTFNANGGEGEMEPVVINAGEPTALPECGFTKEDSNFLGWGTSPEGPVVYSGTDPITLTGEAESLPLYAIWGDIIKCTITFNANGGEGEMEPMVVIADVPANLPECGFTKADSRFIGWGTAPEGPVVYDGTEPITLTGEDETLPLYAIWEDIVKYTVTFNANGGEGEMEPQKIEANVAAVLNAVGFTREKAEFLGWATTAEGGVEYGDQAEITLTDSDIELFAVWKEVSNYTITFIANGGEGEMEPQEVEVGVATALKANAFTRDGFKFQGWATTVNGEVEYANKAEVTLTDSNLELFAVWKQNTIAVIYSPNGGTGLMNPHKLTVNETFNLDKVAYTYTDKTFIGWSTTADGEVEYEDEAEFTIGTKSVVLYAIWKDGAEEPGEPEEPPVDPDPNPKAILFSTGGGNGLMTHIKGLSTGQVVKLPACAYTKDGYTFAGWATTSGGAVVYQDCADFTVGTSNAVLYAVWVA